MNRILLVEDGSVDVDSIKEELGNSVSVIVYRKGSPLPQLVCVEADIKDHEIEQLTERVKVLTSALECAVSLIPEKMIPNDYKDPLTPLGKMKMCVEFAETQLRKEKAERGGV